MLNGSERIARKKRKKKNKLGNLSEGTLGGRGAGGEGIHLPFIRRADADGNRLESDFDLRFHGVLDDGLPVDAVGHAHRRHGGQSRRLLRHEELEAESVESYKGKWST